MALAVVYTPWLLSSYLIQCLFTLYFCNHKLRCVVVTLAEVLPKDKKKREEEKSAVLGQCSVDLLPLLTGFDSCS